VGWPWDHNIGASQSHDYMTAPLPAARRAARSLLYSLPRSIRVAAEGRSSLPVHATTARLGPSCSVHHAPTTNCVASRPGISSVMTLRPAGVCCRRISACTGAGALHHAPTGSAWGEWAAERGGPWAIGQAQLPRRSVVQGATSNRHPMPIASCIAVAAAGRLTRRPVTARAGRGRSESASAAPRQSVPRGHVGVGLPCRPRHPVATIAIRHGARLVAAAAAAATVVQGSIATLASSCDGAKTERTGQPTRVNKVDVVVVGAGPAGVAAAHLLNGHHPRLIRPHPDPRLQKILAHEVADSVNGWVLDVADLRSLTSGLSGRTNNPVANLGDTLLCPGADGGPRTAAPPCVEMQFRPDRALNVALVGDDAKVGGSWNDFPRGTNTLSPGSWMALPGWDLGRWMAATGQDIPREGLNHARLPRSVVSEYYNDVTADISHLFFHGNVTSVTPTDSQGGDGGVATPRWRVHVASASAAEPDLVFEARAVVLATGSYARPRRLDGLEPATHPGLTYRVPNAWPPAPATVLVVGAGMSAADCIVAAMAAGVGVVHVFRGPPDESNIARKFLGQRGGMYSEYGQLCELMKGATQSPLYEPLGGRLRSAVAEGLTCEIELERGGEIVRRRADRVAVLIGSTPDLSFVDDAVLPSHSSGTEPIADPTSAYADRVATHPVYVDTDPYTMEVRSAPGLYAVGPLRGDNFVRFLTADAWGIERHLRSLSYHDA